MIVTCPKYESDADPIAAGGSGRDCQPDARTIWRDCYPGADRIARGEEWLQTNTLDGQKAHDSFVRIGEPSFFQEFGPAGYHVSIGFANPAIINSAMPPFATSPTRSSRAELHQYVTGRVVASA